MTAYDPATTARLIAEAREDAGGWQRRRWASVPKGEPVVRAEVARCPDCDLPIATQADHDATVEGEGADLCWRAWAGDVCCRTPVDWRARALTAEELLERLAEFEIALAKFRAASVG